jgi:hypothetical protein
MNRHRRLEIRLGELPQEERFHVGDRLFVLLFGFADAVAVGGVDAEKDRLAAARGGLEPGGQK